MAGGVSPLQIYQALTKAGASTVQAIGIMANMINESDLNVETGAGGHTIDSNGFPVYGLVSWNTKSYPSASQLVTGNPQADLTAQANYLRQTGGFKAATGATPSEAAGAFAANYERCGGCQPGGAQYNSRVANATTVSQWQVSGNWPKSTGSAAAASGSGGSGGTGPGCLMGNPFSAQLPLIGNISAGPSCLFSTSQARAVIGGIMMGPALVLGTVGAALLVALGFRSSAPRVAAKAGGAAELVGAGVAFIPGAEAAGAGIAAAGAGVRKAGQGGEASARRRADQRAKRRQERKDTDEELRARGATPVDRRGRARPAPIPRSKTPTGPGRKTGTLPGPRDADDVPPF